MDIDAMRTLIREIIPQTAPRRPHKYWVPYAWMVRMLVEAGMGVSDAVRVALRNSDTEVRPKDVASLRVVYYKVKELPWPEGMMERVGGAVKEAVGSESVGSESVGSESVGSESVGSESVGGSDGDTEDTDVGLTEEERRELQEEEARLGALAEQNLVESETGSDPDADPDFQPEEEFEV